MDGLITSAYPPMVIFTFLILFLLVALIGVIMIVARQIDREQANKRHELRGEFHIFMAESEERLTERISRLEDTSYGFRQRKLGDIKE